MPITTIKEAYTHFVRLHGDTVVKREQYDLQDLIFAAQRPYASLDDEFWRVVFDSGWADASDAEGPEFFSALSQIPRTPN